MNLRLKESIIAAGVQHLPPAVIDTKELGISDAEAEVLVRRGTADIVDAPAAEEVKSDQEPAPAPTGRRKKA